MVRRSTLIVAIVLAICAGLAGGYVLWNYPRVTAIAEDSFILSSHVYEHMSQQEYEKYQAWLENAALYTEEDYVHWLWDLSPPFNRFGWYLNRFFLQESETVEVIMKSDEPLGVVEVDEIPAYGVSVITVCSGVSGDVQNLFSATVKRVDGNWELRFAFKAERSGHYFLQILNELPDQVSCRYAVTLRS